MATDFVNNGYIFITIGWRQLPTHGFYDTLFDVVDSIKQIIRTIGSFGGDPTDMTIVAWSGSILIAMTALFQNRDLFGKHIRNVVSLGPTLQRVDYDRKVVMMFDQPHDSDQLYPSYYF